MEFNGKEYRVVSDSGPSSWTYRGRQRAKGVEGWYT